MRPAPILRLSLVLVCLLLLMACTRNPLGMSDAEWQALTPQQQMDAREKQAAIDIEQERLDNEQRIRMAQIAAAEREKQRRQDIAAGMIAEITPEQPLCIGGSRCGGGESRIILPLRTLASVDYIRFLADDRVGNKHDGVALIYADEQLAERVDIKKHKQWHEAFIGKVARNIIIRPETDDELRIYHIKIYGQAMDSGNVQYHIIKQQ